MAKKKINQNKLYEKWDAVSYDDIRKSKTLQKEYLKDFKIPYFEENEKLYNPDVQHNLPVFKPEDEDVNAFRGTLLSVIWNEKVTRNFKKGFYGINGMTRAVLIARMTGYSFKEIAITSDMKTSEIKKMFLEGLQKIINLNRCKCRSCHFRIRYDTCKIWKIRVRKNFYCWVYKKKKGA